MTHETTSDVRGSMTTMNDHIMPTPVLGWSMEGDAEGTPGTPQD